MANTTFSGPILAGTIKNTTGTTVGTDMKNTGQVMMSQTFSFDYTVENTATSTSVIIPANSQIVSIDVNVETAFNDSGTDILEIGSVADTDLYVNDVSIAAVGQQLWEQQVCVLTGKILELLISELHTFIMVQMMMRQQVLLQ